MTPNKLARYLIGDPAKASKLASAKCYRYKNSSPAKKRTAFTLIEVVIAMSVAIVALVGVFALMRSGLFTYRDAVNATVTSSINQQILSQYLLADFKNITNLPTQTNYFDERGLSINTAPATNAIYQSVGEVITNSVLGVGRNNLVELRITVTSPTQPLFRKVSISVIANQGNDLP